jgi:hypothetical protein
MERLLATPVASTTTLLPNQTGKLPQHLEQAVVPLSSILKDKQFSENSETVVILMAILQGITKNTTSGDVIALAIYNAIDVCDALGIDSEVVERTIKRFFDFQKEVRKNNPLAF